MTSPTLKELAAKATKGPWGLEFSQANQAYEIAPFDKAGELDWDREVAMTADDNVANAQLIARCSPEVMLAVYEALAPAALEAMTLLESKIYPFESGITFEKIEAEQSTSSAAYSIMLTLSQLRALRRALALLDGQAGGKEGAP